MADVGSTRDALRRFLNAFAAVNEGDTSTDAIRLVKQRVIELADLGHEDAVAARAALDAQTADATEKLQQLVYRAVEQETS